MTSKIYNASKTVPVRWGNRNIPAIGYGEKFLFLDCKEITKRSVLQKIQFSQLNVNFFDKHKIKIHMQRRCSSKISKFWKNSDFDGE